MKRALVMLAWVLWTHSTFPSQGIDQWTVVGSTETLADCQEKAVIGLENTARKQRDRSEGRGTVVTRTGMVIEMQFKSGDHASIRAVCVPENIDPREPKGK